MRKDQPDEPKLEDQDTILVHVGNIINLKKPATISSHYTYSNHYNQVITNMKVISISIYKPTGIDLKLNYSN